MSKPVHSGPGRVARLKTSAGTFFHVRVTGTQSDGSWAGNLLDAKGRPIIRFFRDHGNPARIDPDIVEMRCQDGSWCLWEAWADGRVLSQPVALDSLEVARMIVSTRDLRNVATCPDCGLSWHDKTPRSWWLNYDRCHACMGEALGVDRVLTLDEMEQFRIRELPASGQLSMFAA